MKRSRRAIVALTGSATIHAGPGIDRKANCRPVHPRGFDGALQRFHGHRGHGHGGG